MTTASNHDAALAKQRSYFDTRRNIRLQPRDTAYIRRHFAEVAKVATLRDGESVCEWGAGLGRFSRLSLACGARLCAIELSPSLANECRAALADEPLARVETGDVASVLERLDERFDLMLGFFVLHHLPELEAYFVAAHAALKPGGRIAFAEPNPWNPLFPVQITLTPGMSWRAEAGIYRLWPGAVRLAASNAGFARVEIGYYGALPRAAYNALARMGIERSVERLVPSRLKPFQTIVAWR
jgi:2-polyprenyl-3-methyl-5-hydroxy-6-metoxy-1,4-benzoquinol methylase